MWDTSGHQSITPCRASNTHYGCGPFTGEKTQLNTPTKHKPITPYSALCTLMIRLEMYSLNFKPFNLSNADLSVVINRNTGTQYGCFIGVNAFLKATARISDSQQISL